MRSCEQVGARRRAAVTALAALLVVSVTSAVAASARPGARQVPSAKRVSSELFDSRATGAFATPSRAVDRARTALAERLGSHGVVIADRQTGSTADDRQAGRLPDRRERQAGRTIGMDYVRSHLLAFGLSRADLRNVPRAAGLRRHRRHPPHLVDPACRRV